LGLAAQELRDPDSAILQVVQTSGAYGAIGRSESLVRPALARTPMSAKNEILESSSHRQSAQSRSATWDDSAVARAAGIGGKDRPALSGCADAPPERDFHRAGALVGVSWLPADPEPLSVWAQGAAGLVFLNEPGQGSFSARGGAVGPSEKTPKNRAISMQSERPI